MDGGEEERAGTGWTETVNTTIAATKEVCGEED